MPKFMKPLTDSTVRQLKKVGLHSVGGTLGLKLQICKGNARSWILRATVNSKVKDIGLGSYPLITLKKARELLSSEVFDDVRGKEMAPGDPIQSDKEILNYIRKTALTVYHPVGTCKMGMDEMSVVDPINLKVKGMSNLRVIDASIMPNITSGNTSAPTMMIAEMGSKMILNKD